MKILWIVSSGWKEGGVENLLYVAKGLLQKLGHEVEILSSDDRPDMPHFSDVEFKTPSGFWRPILYTFNTSSYTILKKVIDEFKPDIIHIHTTGHTSPSIFFGLKGVPTVVTVHGPEAYITSLIPLCFSSSDFINNDRVSGKLRLVGKLRYIYHRYVNRPLYYWGFKNISKIITPSIYMNKLVENGGYSNTCLHNGTLLFNEHSLSEAASSQTIAFAGRLESYKGVDYLIRAFKIVKKEFPDATLAIAGSGRELSRLKELTSKLQLESSVEFMGHVGRSELESLYARSLIAVMSSTWVEAFGLSGIEAMSVGRPVVASRVGGIPDWLIDGKTGLLVEPGDDRALGVALLKLLSDQKLLSEMAHAARKRSEEFTLEMHVGNLLNLYNEVILHK